MLEVVNDSGRIVATGGEITESGGLYLPWLGARLDLGTAADTVVSIGLADATVTYWTYDGGSSIVLQRQQGLGSYFAPPSPREEVISYRWIQIGGDQIKILQARPIEAAALGPGGNIYVIRNYAAEWYSYKDRVFATNGVWLITQRGLEVYNPEGRLLGAWRLPEIAPKWLRVDRNGRIFLGDNHSVVIVADPLVGLACPPITMQLQLDDEPASSAAKVRPLGGR